MSTDTVDGMLAAIFLRREFERLNGGAAHCATVVVGSPPRSRSFPLSFLTVGRVGRRATGRAAEFLFSAPKGFVMKSIHLLVRDAARSLRGAVSPPWAGALLGALAADPETFAELDVAMQRFQVDAAPEQWRAEFVASDEEPDPESWGAIIDLPTRLVFWSGGPGPDSDEGVAPVLDQGEPTSVELPYELPSSWQIVHSRDGWRERVEMARECQRNHPPLDVRRALYEELAPWLADALCSGRFNNADDPVAAIHAAWLSTPRDDLAGQTPRDLLIACQTWTEQEMQWRRGEWSRLGRQPPGVPRESRAYRHGGIGVHEFIMYYDLVRHLLSRAWEEQPGDFGNRETVTGWLRYEQSQWLLNPVHEGTADAYVPGEVIDCERQRIPLVADAESQMIDCDCPLCQMMAEESFGPTFIHFDTYHFDLEFVFSSYLSEQEWENDYSLYGKRASNVDGRDEPDVADSDLADELDGATRIDASRSGAPDSRLLVGVPMRANLIESIVGTPDDPVMGSYAPNGYEPGRVLDTGLVLWKNSRLAAPPPSASRSQRLQSVLFEVAAHSMELREDVRELPEQRRALERLIEDFANLRAAMRQEDFERVRRLTDGCVQALSGVSAVRREFVDKCADLEASFRRLEQTICEAEADDARSARRD